MLLNYHYLTLFVYQLTGSWGGSKENVLLNYHYLTLFVYQLMESGGRQGECAPKLSLSGSVCVSADGSWGEGDVWVGVLPEGVFLAVIGTKNLCAFGFI